MHRASAQQNRHGWRNQAIGMVAPAPNHNAMRLIFIPIDRAIGNPIFIDHTGRRLTGIIDVIHLRAIHCVLLALVAIGQPFAIR